MERNVPLCVRVGEGGKEQVATDNMVTGIESLWGWGASSRKYKFVHFIQRFCRASDHSLLRLGSLRAPGSSQSLRQRVLCRMWCGGQFTEEDLKEIMMEAGAKQKPLHMATTLAHIGVMQRAALKLLKVFRNRLGKYEEEATRKYRHPVRSMATQQGARVSGAPEMESGALKGSLNDHLILRQILQHKAAET